MASTKVALDRPLRILLTGASGYVGQHLLREWLAVFATDNKDTIPSGPSRSLLEFLLSTVDGSQAHPGALLHVVAQCHSKASQLQESLASLVNSAAPRMTVQVVPVDVSDPEQLKAFLSQQEKQPHGRPFHVVIHTAALSSPRFCQTNADSSYKLNVQPTKALLQSASRLAVMFSTDQVYPGTDPPYGEESVVLSLTNSNADTTKAPCNVYGKTKLQMEQKCLEYALQASSHNADTSTSVMPRIVVLRSSIVLGPPVSGAHETFLQFCASQFRHGIATTYWTTENRNVISITNVLQILSHLVFQSLTTGLPSSSSPSLEVYNMGGPASVSRYDMAMAVAQHLLSTESQHLSSNDITTLVVGQTKTIHEATMASVPSPLDISMKVQKIQTIMKDVQGFSWKNLDDIVHDTFTTS